MNEKNFEVISKYIFRPFIICLTVFFIILVLISNAGKFIPVYSDQTIYTNYTIIINKTITNNDPMLLEWPYN